MWHIHSETVGLCLNDCDTQQWHIHHSERKKNELTLTGPTSVISSSQRRIINCNISWLINWNMKTVLPRLMAHIFISMLYGMGHWTLLDRSKVKLLQWGAELEIPRQTVICHSPLMKAPPAVAAWLSARWQRDFNRQSYLSENKSLQIFETNIE